MSSGAEVVVVLPFVLAELIGQALIKTVDVALEQAEDRYRDRLREGVEAANASAGAAALAQAAHLSQAAMVQVTRLTAAQDANRAFLVAAVERLQASAPADPSPDGAQARCTALSEALAKGTEPLSVLQARFTALAAEVRARPAPGPDDAPVVDLSAFDLITELLASPLLEAEERTAWQTRVAELRALATRESELAAQGLTALRRQVEHALQAAAEHAEARAQVAAELREEIGIALPRLQVVAEKSPVPAQQARAKAMLAEIARFAVLTPEDALPSLRALSSEAEALFEAFRAAVKQALQQEALSAQVSDVLLSLGYRVAEAQDDGTLVTPLTQNVGVSFAVDGEGKLVSEMVALSPGAVEMDAQDQEHVCALVDEVIAGLRERQCTVKERRRKRHQGRHALRVVSLPQTTTTATPQSAANTQYLRKES